MQRSGGCTEEGSPSEFSRSSEADKANVAFGQVPTLDFNPNSLGRWLMVLRQPADDRDELGEPPRPFLPSRSNAHICLVDDRAMCGRHGPPMSIPEHITNGDRARFFPFGQVSRTGANATALARLGHLVRYGRVMA